MTVEAALKLLNILLIIDIITMPFNVWLKMKWQHLKAESDKTFGMAQETLKNAIRVSDHAEETSRKITETIKAQTSADPRPSFHNPN